MKIKMNRVFRYLGLAAAILFFLWIAALAAVYFFVDVNKVKQAALTYVNQNTKGELSVGEVKLKLFPIVHFEVKDIDLKSSVDFQRKDLFKCARANLSFGIISLIFGKPNIGLELDTPYVDFIVKENKVNNISDLMIKKDESKTEEKTEAKTASTDKKKDNLYYLFISKFTFDVKNAELKYTSPKAKYDVKSLSFKLMVDPADKSIELKAGSPLDIKDKKFSVSGSWDTDIEVKPTRGDDFNISAMFDATRLSYVSDSFVKPKGVPLKVEITAVGNETSLNVKKAVVTLFKPWLTMSGKVANLKTEDSPMTLNISAAPLEIENFKKLLPALKTYDMSGTMDSKVAVSGTLQKFLLDAELDATNAQLKSEGFDKAKGIPLKVKLIVAKSKEAVDVQLLKLWLIDDMAEANAKITDLEAENPNVQFNIKYLNLDLAKLSKVIPAIKKNKMSGTLKIAAATKGTNNFTVDISSASLSIGSPADGKKASGKAAKSSESAKASAPIDKKKELVTKEQVKSLNELLSKYSLAMNMKINKLLYNEFAFTNLIAQITAAKGVFTVNKFKADAFGGSLSSGLTFAANVAKPSYNANFDASNLKVKEAVGTMMPDLKGVIDGVLSGKISVAASGYTVGDVQKSLTGNGNFAFNNFVYSSKELNQVIGDKLSEKLGKFMPMKGKNIFGGNPGWETVQGTFNIKNENINVEKILAKEKEYLAEGNGKIDFNKYMDMNFMVTVPYGNLPYEPFKVEKKNLSQLPLHLTGPVAKPKLDGMKLAQYFIEKTLDNEKKKLKAKVNQETQKVKAQATDKIKNAIKGIKF